MSSRKELRERLEEKLPKRRVPGKRRLMSCSPSRITTATSSDEALEEGAALLCMTPLELEGTRDVLRFCLSRAGRKICRPHL